MLNRASAVVCLLLAVAGCQAAGPMASWGTSGQLYVSDHGQQLAVAEAGLFEAGWAYHAAAPDRAVRTTPPERALKLTLNDKRTIGVIGKVEAVDGGCRLEYRFTPPGAVKVNSVHMGWTLPVSRWSGARWEVDGRAGNLPKTFDQAGLYAGKSSKLVLTATDGQKLELTMESPANVLIQDDRQWGGANYTLRVIGLLGDGVSFGEPLTVAAKLRWEPAMSLEVDQPVTLTAGADWLPLASAIDVEPGSALDFSPLGLLDAPAGKYGPLVASGERFVFAGRPNVPVRLYGVNICFSALYADHATADKLAARLAAIGYNTVRIHHYEGGLIDRKAPNSLTFNSEALDRLDYFVAALKQRGLYITTDLFVSRPIKASETEDGGTEMDDYKVAVLVSDKARGNLKDWSRALLGHVNPYTKLAWGQDPALCSLSLVNEGMVLNFLGRLKGTVRRQFGQQWNAWLLKRYGSREKLAAAWGNQLKANEDPAAGTVALPGNNNQADLQRFAADLHAAFYEDMKAFLRGELKCVAPLTDINAWTENWPNQGLRAHYDYVDNHSYWDHPSFLEGDWRLPSKGWSGGGSATAGGAPLHMDKAPTRLLDKPFGFSEFNYASPNAYRAESGPLTGAYAALQGWDAIWRFAFSHDVNNLTQPRAGNYFDVAVDPALQASDRFAVLLFLRDTATARSTVALTAASGTSPATGLTALKHLSLISRLGTRIDASGAAPAGELRLDASKKQDEAGALAALRAGGLLSADNPTDLTAGVFVSDTGQLRLEPKAGQFVFNTPRCAGVYTAFGRAATAGPVVVGETTGGVGVYVASLSDAPLADSPRLVVAHLPEVQGEGRKYAERARLTLLDWGKLPHLVRNVTTPVTLKLTQPRAYKVYALALDGRRLGEVKAAVVDGALTFGAASGYEGQGVLYYEVVR